MKNWSKFITLSSAIVLVSTSPITVFANENTGARSDISAVVNTPVEGETILPPSDTAVPTIPSKPTEGDVVTPTDPNITPSTTEQVGNNTSPTSPSETPVPSTGKEETSTPTEPSNPSTTEEPTEPKNPSASTEPKGTDKPEESTSKPTPSDSSTPMTDVPTINGGTATIPTDVNTPTNNPNVSAQTAHDVGASQVGTTSTVTGQVVSNVSVQAPVYTNTGYQIVSTQNSQVIVAYSDGSTAIVAPKVVGGTVNKDQTISIKTSSGEMATLPSTGEEESLLMSMVGTGLLAGLIGYFFKKKSVKNS